MIEWAGVRSDDLGIVVEHYPKPIIPERKQSIQSIEGRSGDILLSTNAFKNYNQPYEVFLDSKEKGGLLVVFPKLVDWLMGNEGYQRLEDSYFPDFYRMAFYSGGADFLTMFNEYGRGTLTFNCNPCKYYKSGEQEVALSNNGSLFNPSSFTALPLIKFKTVGTSSGQTIHPNNTYASIAINDQPNVVFNISQFAVGTEITIDVAAHTVTKKAPGNYSTPQTYNYVELTSQPSFANENKWYEFEILDSNGHLQQTVYDLTPSESVEYELVDGRLVMKVQTMNSGTYGQFEDLVLKKGSSVIKMTRGTDLRVTPRWWTI